jgi:hypothetical protein
MTLGIIEGMLFLGMVGLIWVMLDIFAGNHHTDDKRQASVSPDYHTSMHRPVLPSRASQEQQEIVSLPAALIDRLRNATCWTGDPPLVDLVAEAIEDIVTQMEEINGEAFPQHVSPLKREAMSRRALSGPLR